LKSRQKNAGFFRQAKSAAYGNRQQRVFLFERGAAIGAACSTGTPGWWWSMAEKRQVLWSVFKLIDYNTKKALIQLFLQRKNQSRV